MDFKQLIQGYIELKFGGSCSQQFEDTFDGAEEFDKQNTNALRYILGCCNDIHEAEFLTDEYQNELKEYIDNLSEYLKS